jgi:hypothetical protein
MRKLGTDPLLFGTPNFPNGSDVDVMSQVFVLLANIRLLSNLGGRSSRGSASSESIKCGVLSLFSIVCARGHTKEWSSPIWGETFDPISRKRLEQSTRKFQPLRTLPDLSFGTGLTPIGW